MSMNEMESKIRELRQLQSLIEEAQAEAEAIKDSIKAHMGDAEELKSGDLEDRDQQPPGHRRPEEGRPRRGRRLHQDHHHPPFLRCMRKAPCINARQSWMQEAHGPTGAGLLPKYSRPARKYQDCRRIKIMTMKMVSDLNQFFSENMQEPVPELAAEAEQSYDSLLKKLEKGFSAKEYMDLEDAVMDLAGLFELKGFAWGLAAAREMVGLQMLSAGSSVTLGCGQS